jgi:GDP-4-dehydro-6-deoxy-D-mannose reductase
MKALVTGIDGFVGNHLSNYLLKEGYEVYGTTIQENFEKKNVNIHHMNILDKEEVKKILDEIKPNQIYHLAGQSAVGLSWKDPVLTIDININGTLNLMDAIKDLKLNTSILIIGSSDQYGIIRPEECPVNEEHIQNPQSPYGISKKTQEELAKLYSKAYNMNIIMVRPFNHIGAGQGLNFVVSDFASKIADIEKGADPVLKVGNLETYRDFTDVKDIVKGYVMLMNKGKKGEVYNIGSGKKIKVYDILKKLTDMSKVSIKIEIDPDKFRPVDVPLIVCDNSKILNDTGWSPEITLDDTLSEILKYWRNKSRV